MVGQRTLVCDKLGFEAGLGNEGSRLTRVLMVCAVTLSLVFNAHYLLFSGFSPWAIDFYVFWSSAFKPASELYAASNQPFVYPPTAIVFFKPLAWLSLTAGYLAWTFLSSSLFAIAVTRLTGWRVAALSLLSAGALQGLALGQTPMILSAALLFAIATPGFACGAIFGVAAAIKPQLLVLAPLAFLVRKDWRTLSGMAAGLVVCVIVELVLYGPQLWFDWLNSMTAFREALYSIGAISQVITPYGVADRLGLNPLPFLVVSAALAVAAIVVSAKRFEGVYLVAAIVGASILASPYALRHDTIALVPACIAAILAHPKLKMLPAIGIFSGYFVGVSLVFAAVLQLATLRRVSRYSATHRDPS